MALVYGQTAAIGGILFQAEQFWNSRGMAADHRCGAESQES